MDRSDRGVGAMTLGLGSEPEHDETGEQAPERRHQRQVSG
jgi:hypothetical protein